MMCMNESGDTIFVQKDLFQRIQKHDESIA